MSRTEDNQRSGGAQHSTHASRRRPILRHAPLALAIAALGAAQAQTASPQEDTLGITQMDTVVVTASGFEQEIKNAPASISVITREQLESKPFHNLADAVADVEGVSVERGGKAGGMNISIRGLPSDYTLVLVDGKRLSQNSSGARPNGFGDVDTNFIPPMSAIDRIEVVRGPMSTLYGSDAMGGVINIITRKVAREWTGQVIAGRHRLGRQPLRQQLRLVVLPERPAADRQAGPVAARRPVPSPERARQLPGQPGRIRQRRLLRRHRQLQRPGRQPAAQRRPAPGAHAQPQPRHPVRRRRQLADLRQRQRRTRHPQRRRGAQPPGRRL